MNITKVNYGKTFSLGNYCSERIDLEASIDEGEDIELVFAQLKKQVSDIHKFNNPHLYQEQEPTTKWDGWNEIKQDGTWEMVSNPSGTPINTNLIEGTYIGAGESSTLDKRSPTEKIIHSIYHCTELPVLETFEKLVQMQEKKYPEIRTAYNKKHSQLTNNQ